ERRSKVRHELLEAAGMPHQQAMEAGAQQLSWRVAAAIEDEHAAESSSAEMMLRELWEESLAAGILTEREIFVLTYLYSLDGKGCRTERETGEQLFNYHTGRMGIEANTVTAIHHGALARIRSWRGRAGTVEELCDRRAAIRTLPGDKDLWA